MSVQGRCIQMCPPTEIEMRERERLLHPLEIVEDGTNRKHPKADPLRAVKSFSRSAAGIDLASADILRPAPVLIKTVRYLLTNVLCNSRYNLMCKYDFIVDRLRAVQQDMVIQALPPGDCVQILEPIVKFHCIFGYRLCTESLSYYDPVLNRKHLLEYIKRLLVCYDEIENTNTMLDYKIQKLQISNNSYEDSQDDPVEKRRLTEAIYIMCNLGDVHPLERYLQLPKKLKTGYVKTCFEVSISHLTRNWVRQCHLMKNHKIPPIALCGGVLYLPSVRRTALQVMSVAYNNRMLKYPVENLASLLLCDHQNIVKECHYFNLQMVDNQFVCFSKDSFKFNKEYPLTKLKFLDDLVDKIDLVTRYMDS